MYYAFVLEDKKPKDKELMRVFKIIQDLSDRRGLRQEWEQIDGEIQDEIIEKWLSILKGEL